jgi:glycosyl hydrolase family 59 (putative galactocerebrosidase)
MKPQRLVIMTLASLLSLLLIVLLGLDTSRGGRAEQAAPLLSYPDLTPTITIAPPPAAGPSIAGARLAAESFDSPAALTHWQIVDPAGLPREDHANWNIQDGALVQDGAGAAHDPNTHETMALLGDPGWTDYTVSAKVYDQQNVTFGLVARRQNNSFYRYRIIADSFSGTPKQVLEKVMNGVATPLATHDAPGYTQRQWHIVALTVAGASIRVTLDGTLVAETTDASLASGQAGLYTRAIGGIRFDDVVITTP